MANNRMYLCYKPTGRIIYLGKRMAFGWYGAIDNLTEKMNDFFSECEDDCNEYNEQDDFCLVMDDADNAEHALDKAQRML